MIHLQNKGIPIKHIIAGLHDGVAKNYKSTLVNNRDLQTPIAFIGGYASNGLARLSFEKILVFLLLRIQRLNILVWKTLDRTAFAKEFYIS